MRVLNLTREDRVEWAIYMAKNHRAALAYARHLTYVEAINACDECGERTTAACGVHVKCRKEMPWPSRFVR